MQTTALFIEILVIGIQGCVWVGLFTIAFAGDRWLPSFTAALSGWETLATVVAGVFAYTLGIIIDRISDVVMHFTKDRTMRLLRRIPFINKHHECPPDDRITILHAHEQSVDFLEFIRNRTRVARATPWNCLLITAGAVALCVSKGAAWQVTAASLGIGLIAFAAAWFAHGVLELTLEMRTRHIRELMK